MAMVFSFQFTVTVQVTGVPATVEQAIEPFAFGNSAARLVPQFLASKAAICAGVHAALVQLVVAALSVESLSVDPLTVKLAGARPAAQYDWLARIVAASA